MKKRKNSLNEAINALKNESVSTSPLQEVIDTTLQKLTQASYESHSTIIKERIKTVKSFTKVAAAAVIIIAAVLSITFLDKSMPQASAAEVLAEAAEAVANLRSVYIKAQMRTVEHDNFALIGLDYDFVPVEMWKEFDSPDGGRCRFEKPRRIVVTEGGFELSLLLIKPNLAAKGRGDIGSVRWLKTLLDVDKVLDSEIKLAQQEDSELLLTHEKDPNKLDKLVVIVDAYAKGDFTNDWCKNTSIATSDNRRIYRFDAVTKLLEGLQVYVYPDDDDEVLVFEITNIQYNIDIESTLFTIELPDDVIWFEEPKVLSERYQQMSPKEVAKAFFQACGDEDWDEVIKLMSQTAVSQEIKDYLGGLKIIGIGKPFKSGLYPGWFVPYEIRFRNGRIKKMNLAVRNDNKANRYIVDGGY